MKQSRPELIRGLVVLFAFFALIVSTELLFPYSFEQEGYTVVDIRRLDENPQILEGVSISSSATIISVSSQTFYHSAEVVEGVTLVFPPTMTPPVVGQRILFRGTSWLSTNGTILIQEFYALDTNSTIIRSIPGIILFFFMFFMIFAVDIKRLVFVSKKGGVGDT
ncbi:MAG: hypothetical protein ACFFEV_10990 [Candidatus Thorarchaeota archaeon]